MPWSRFLSYDSNTAVAAAVRSAPDFWQRTRTDFGVTGRTETLLISTITLIIFDLHNALAKGRQKSGGSGPRRFQKR